LAISEVHYRLLEQLREEGKLPQKCDLLEIGEANWYGDFDPATIGILSGTDSLSYRQVVLRMYDNLIQPNSVTSIDQGGGDKAIRHDLNQSIDLEREFGIVVNHGTAEHVFNIANVYRVAHDHCEVGGMMIHESPWLGWPDHGFYCLQPTLFYDVARANNYRIELLCGEDITNKNAYRFDSREDLLQQVRAGDLPDNLCLFVAFRKLFDKPFEIPQQHIYTGYASREVQEAWLQLR